MSETSSSQDICSECGLCCTGALHQRVPLQEDEVKRVVKHMPHSIFRIQGQPKMKLPCVSRQGNICTMYNERPNRCRAYQCKLLDKYISGLIPRNEAIAIIEQAKNDLTNKSFLSEHFEDQLVEE